MCADGQAKSSLVWRRVFFFSSSRQPSLFSKFALLFQPPTPAAPLLTNMRSAIALGRAASAMPSCSRRAASSPAPRRVVAVKVKIGARRDLFRERARPSCRPPSPFATAASLRQLSTRAPGARRDLPSTRSFPPNAPSEPRARGHRRR